MEEHSGVYVMHKVLSQLQTLLVADDPALLLRPNCAVLSVASEEFPVELGMLKAMT